VRAKGHVAGRLGSLQADARLEPLAGAVDERDQGDRRIADVRREERQIVEEPFARRVQDSQLLEDAQPFGFVVRRFQALSVYVRVISTSSSDAAPTARRDATADTSASSPTPWRRIPQPHRRGGQIFPTPRISAFGVTQRCMRLRRTIVLLLLLLLSVFVLGARRRPTRSDPVCPPVTLNLTTTPRSVCQSGVVTLSWQASDPSAFVVLDGFAGTYGASGALTFATAPRVITGHASVACGAGPTGTTTVAAGGAPTGALTGASTIAQNSSTTLHVTAVDTAQWTISSSLGNPLSPTFGAASQDVVYTGSRSGGDTVTVRLVSSCGEEALRSLGINVTASTQPPPPVSGLRCCDGTFSPTCTSCAHKQGCCSSHGGVCGC